ncbi:MAG: Bug family tripartite tricarboxylate transporter substrate binding protein [Rhodospirillaceae bacterium]
MKSAFRLLCAAALMSCGLTAAEDYPTKPVRVIVSTSASGGTDAVARIFAQRLTDRFGQTFVIDNRGGATGLIGMDIVANAAPDGYTLLVMNVGHLMSALTRDASYDMNRVYSPVTELGSTPSILAVHPSVPAKNLAEFVKLAKSQPGKILYASGGQGGVQHFSTVLFEREASVKLVHVPYKGSGPGIVDLLGGQVQMTLTSMPPIVPHVKAGKLRGLAVTSKSRSNTVPEVPTFAESGLPGVDVQIWYGMFAPPRSPRAIVEKLAGAAAAIAKMPDIREKLASQGAVAYGSTPAELAAYAKSERDKWVKVGREAGLVAR